MSIDSYGKVSITKDEVLIKYFVFDCKGFDIPYVDECRLEALMWARKELDFAIDRLKKETDSRDNTCVIGEKK